MLLRLAIAIVRGRKAVMAVAALLVIIGLWGVVNSRINYDLMSYLPADLDSMKGLTIVDDEFALGTMIQILVYDETDATVDALKGQIEQIEGVKAVHWVTDLAPVSQPVEFRGEVVIENYYAGGGTLLQVAFDGGSNDPHVKQAIRDIRDSLEGYETLVTGNQQLELEEVMNQDTVKFAVVALVLVTIVLLLTMPSIVVPLTFVAVVTLLPAQGQQLSGINTTIGGLGDMGDGIGDGVTEARRGEVLTEAMKRAADAYTSFLGLPEGAEGHLSFLFKVEGVVVE